MKVIQEKLPASQIGLEIEITPEMSKKAYDHVIQDLSRTVSIPGFRKGKVPRQILLQRLGTTRIKAAALEELIQNGMEEAIKQEAIEAIGNYQLRSSFEELITKFQPGEPFIFSASVDVEPEVKAIEYKGLSFKAEEVQYDPSQVDRVLEQRRAEQATLIPVEGRAAQPGDVAIVDYVGRFAASNAEDETPEEIPGGKAEQFQIDLVEGRFVEGFVNGIVGMNTGETKEVSVQFPEEYAHAELAGKATVFTITLQELKEKELPELNDEFVQEISDFQTLAELRESLELKFKKEAEEKTKTNKSEALINELINRLEVEIPETLINREIDYLLRQTALQMGNYGLDVNKFYTQENMPQLKERSRPDALVSLQKSLAIEEVARRESIQVEAAEIDARIEELIQQFSDRPLDPVKVRDYVTSELTKEKTLAWLEENATIELVPEGSLTQAVAEAPDATEPEVDPLVQLESGALAETGD